MATTANYDWPLPSPGGNQMEEVAKIATSLIAIDAKLKSSETALSTHKHKFTDLLERPTTLGGYGITDGMTATEVAAAIQQAVSDLVNGSGAALDTLKELADALGNDPEFATTVSNALALRIRVDAAQSFSLAQKAQGRSNLDALGTVDKGKEGGVASLDGNGKVPSTQLPTMDYLPRAGGTLSGALQIQAPGNKVIRFLRADGTRSAAIYANPDADTGLNIHVDDAAGTNTKFFAFGHDGVFRSPGSIAAGASGVLEGNGNVWGSAYGASGNLLTWLANTGTYLSAAAYPRRSDGAKMTFQWSGQPGQPAWLWGGNGDGTAFQVWNPANFNVNWANGAAYADRLGNNGWTLGDVQNYINDRAYWRTQEYLLAELIPVGGYTLAGPTGNETIGIGADRSGVQLYYKNTVNNSSAGQINYGTWRNVASSASQTGPSLFKRIG
ncbi:hypothetical protein [Ochrobactrum quorumnocens]|nr:hypothetical protein [[Ochrobactrum] quorumnocens]